MGKGTIYKRGKVYWIKYHHNGKPFYESAQSSKWADAANLLSQRLGDAAKGKPVGVRFDKVMFADLMDGFLEYYRLKGQKKPKIKHLKRFFGGMRVVEITTTEIK
jgi:hypothetical protein